MKKSVLTRYRVMAYVTAVMLLVLCACMVFKYGFDKGADLTFVVSQATACSTWSTWSSPSTWAPRRSGPSARCSGSWSPGTIPPAAFFVERKVRPEVEPLVADDARPREGPRRDPPSHPLPGRVAAGCAIDIY